MFGDVGGLNDFIALSLASIFGLLSEKFLHKDLIQKLFHVTSLASGGYKSPKTILRSFKSLKIPLCLLLCPSRFKEKKKRLFKLAMSRTEDSLDVIKLIRNSRVLKTLLRLLLSKDERRLILF